MARRLFAVLALLLAGAAATFVVAQAFALWGPWNAPPKQPTPVQTLGPGARWPTAVAADWPAPERHFRSERTGLVMSSWFTVLDAAASYHEDRTLVGEYMTDVWDVGWPWPACTGVRTRAGSPMSPARVERFGVMALPPVLAGLSDYPLLLHPIWAPFLADTVFYAIVLWLGLVGVRSVRRRRRRRQGRCVSCGYRVVEASSGCPECGFGRE